MPLRTIVSDLAAWIRPKPTVIVHEGHTITLDWGWHFIGRERLLIDKQPFGFTGRGDTAGYGDLFYSGTVTEKDGRVASYLLQVSSFRFGAPAVTIKRFENRDTRGIGMLVYSSNRPTVQAPHA